MQIPRRFVFRGNASAFGGFVFRPQSEVFEVNGASSLDVVGGRSVAEIPEHKWRFASFAGARTSAEGLFEEFRDAKPEKRTEDRNPRDEELHPVPTVWAEALQADRRRPDSVRGRAFERTSPITEFVDQP